jgi:hypothetical protein
MTSMHLERPLSGSVRAIGVLAFSVTICVTAVGAGCRERKAAAPEVSSPAAFGSQQSLPKPPPPPPDARETKVLPLDSDSCTTRYATLIDFTSAEVLARCDSTAPTTRVILTVVPRTTDPADYVRALSLRFCGEVLNARGPSGWRVEIGREKSRSDAAADVKWERPDAAAPSEMPASSRIGGFEVTFQGQWRRGQNWSVAFSRSGGLAYGSPHDCPYPFQ